MEELRAAAGFAVADPEPAGLVVGGVGGAGYFPVVVPARHPGFEVVLAVGGAAEVAGTDVHDAVWKVEALEDVFLYLEHFVVHRFGLFRRREGEHLDLGELVDAVEAAARAAVGAGLSAEAVGEPGEADGEILLVQDLVGQGACERDLGRSDEREARILDGVDLGLRTPRNKAGPDE